MLSLTDQVDAVIGVDTHVNTHSAAVLDASTAGVLAEMTVEARTSGYQALVAFADQHAATRAWAIEGTGSHGAGLTRFLAMRGEWVIEVDRPARSPRRNGAKSDAIDAVRAGREALARARLSSPRAGGDRHALSVLLAVRRSAVKASADAQRQLFALVIAAPEPLRARFRAQRIPAMLTTALALRTHRNWDCETTTTARILRTLARRIRTLQAEAADHKRQIQALVEAWRPDLLAQPGVGPISAAMILCAWSHPERIRSEAAFAMLAGVAPIPANSGQTTTRYRLNRHGDRQLNRALHTVVLVRQRCHQPTITYVERRTTDGKTPREIRRCLKRYVARDLFRLLENGTAMA